MDSNKELEYILKRILWLTRDRIDSDTYSEIVDWIKDMENEITYGDLDGQDGDEYFINGLIEKLTA